MNKGGESDRAHGPPKECGCYFKLKGSFWRVFQVDMAQWGSKLLLPGFLNPEATQRPQHWQEKRRNKKRRKCIRELIGTHRKHLHSNKPAASTETSTSSQSCSPSRAAGGRGTPAVTMLSISILLLANTEKDISKTFKNNFQTTQGWEEKRERKITVCLLKNSDNDNKECR